jgi:hypothetical protein
VARQPIIGCISNTVERRIENQRTPIRSMSVRSIEQLSGVVKKTS